MQTAWSGDRRLGLGNRLASRFLNQVDAQNGGFFPWSVHTALMSWASGLGSHYAEKLVRSMSRLANVWSLNDDRCSNRLHGDVSLRAGGARGFD